jgi:hypothetical protein
MIGLLVLKMSRQVTPIAQASPHLELVTDSEIPEAQSLPPGHDDSPLIRDAKQIIASAEVRGEAVSQRALAAQLGSIAHSAVTETLDRAA